MALFRRHFPPSYPREFFTRDDDLLDVFWRINLQNHEAPGHGVALLCFQVEGIRVRQRFKNDFRSEVHAEEHLIRYLWNAESQLYGKVKVEIFQNYSPCSKCAIKYCQLMQDFQEHGVFLTVEIHFVSLYRICHNIEEPTEVDWYLTKRLHWLNVGGLTKMSEAGILLKGFKKNTWFKLLGRLCVLPQKAFDKHYDRFKAQNDSHCRDKRAKILACPESLIKENTTNLRSLYTNNNGYNYCYNSNNNNGYNYGYPLYISFRDMY